MTTATTRDARGIVREDSAKWDPTERRALHDLAHDLSHTLWFRQWYDTV